MTSLTNVRLSERQAPSRGRILEFIAQPWTHTDLENAWQNTGVPLVSVPSLQQIQIRLMHLTINIKTRM